MEVDINYFIWKYIKNPSGEAICIAVKDSKNNVVAFEALMPEEYVFNNETKIFYHSVDTMTHSMHRRKGLYQQIAFKGFDILKEKNNLFEFGFGGDMSTPAILKFGWKIIFNVNFYFKTLTQSFVSNLFFVKNKTIQKLQVKEIEDIDEISNLLKGLNKSAIHKLLNKDILNWKLSHPLYDFKKTGIYNKSNQLEAYLIYYIQNNKVFIYDFALKQNNKTIEKLLFNYIDKIVIRDKLKGIVSFAQNDIAFSKRLKKNGFITNNFNFGPLNKKLPFMIYTLPEKFEVYNNPQQWSITPINHDSL